MNASGRSRFDRWPAPPMISRRESGICCARNSAVGNRGRDVFVPDDDERRHGDGRRAPAWRRGDRGGERWPAGCRSRRSVQSATLISASTSGCSRPVVAPTRRGSISAATASGTASVERRHHPIARGAAFGGIGGRPGVREHQAIDPVGRETRNGERRVSAEREAADVRAADLETIQQRRDVAHVIVEHGRLAFVIVGAAEAGEIRRQSRHPSGGASNCGSHICAVSGKACSSTSTRPAGWPASR